MPGIDTGAPERTETSSGFVGVAERLAGRLFEAREVALDLGAQRVGNWSRRADTRCTPRRRS